MIDICGTAIGVRDGICVLPVGMTAGGIEAGSLESARAAYPGLLSVFGELERDATGVVVNVPAGIRAAEPLCIAVSGSGRCTIAVSAGEGSAAELVFLFSDGASADRIIIAGKDSVLKIKEIVCASKDGSVSISAVMNLGAGARTETVTVELGEGDTALKYVTSLSGKSASALHAGLFMAAEGERKEMDVRVEHLVPDCRSDVLVKGVASGTGHGSFNGMVYVARDAQHTEAYQQSRNLVMGVQARIVTSPQLEIYADDVKCSHGATVGQMNDDAVFYMRQRGLSEEQARGLQLTGFVNDVISRFGGRELAERVLAAAEGKIGRLQQSAPQQCDR